MIQGGEHRKNAVPQSIFIQPEVANTDDKWLLTASSKISNERFLFFQVHYAIGFKKNMCFFLF